MYLFITAAALRYNKGPTWSKDFVTLCTSSKKVLEAEAKQLEYNRERSKKTEAKCKRSKKRLPKSACGE